MIRDGLERLGEQIREGMLESLHCILKATDKPMSSLYPPLSLSVVEGRTLLVRIVHCLCNYQPPLL